MTSAITPQVTHPPLPVAEHLIPRDNGYGVHEVAAVTLGGFVGRVWRHVHRDGDGTRFELGEAKWPRQRHPAGSGLTYA